MIIIYNNILPIKGYVAINIFGLIFARKECKPLEGWMLNHELIHTRQMTEMLFVPFYLWYGIEWLVRIMQYRDTKQAYYHISFEREAYATQHYKEYLKYRKFLSFTKYLKNGRS